jgi:hypothetical protein
MSSSEAMEDMEPGVCAAQHAGAGARGDRGGVGRLLAPRPCLCASLGRGSHVGTSSGNATSSTSHWIGSRAPLVKR